MGNQEQKPNLETPTTPEQSINKPKPKWLIPVIVIAGIIVLGLVVWGAYEVFKSKPMACTEEARECPDGSFVARNSGLDCEFDPCPEVKDETADWETYRNEEYGFEFRYPKDFIIKDAETMVFAFETPDSEFQELYNDFYKQNFSFRMNGAEFHIGAYTYEEKLTLAEWIDKERWSEMLSDYSGTISSINGLTVVFDEWRGWGGPSDNVNQFNDFLEENNKNLVDFSPYHKSFGFYNEKTGVSVGIGLKTIESKEISYKSVFNQILSTFKFID